MYMYLHSRSSATAADADWRCTAQRVMQHHTTNQQHKAAKCMQSLHTGSTAVHLETDRANDMLPMPVQDQTAACRVAAFASWQLTWDLPTRTGLLPRAGGCGPRSQQQGAPHGSCCESRRQLPLGAPHLAPHCPVPTRNAAELPGHVLCLLS